MESIQTEGAKWLPKASSNGPSKKKDTAISKAPIAISKNPLDVHTLKSLGA